MGGGRGGEEGRNSRRALLKTDTVLTVWRLEFVNTLNNTISGIIYLRDHALYPGTACTVNGFVGQLSVQAADFSILVIALVTLLTITRTTYMPAASTSRKTLICLSVWVVPLATACVATSLGAVGPVSGNWCWIMATRTDLRYALTHGWRIAIIFVTAGIYAFVWWYMNRHFRSVVSSITTASSFGEGSSWSGRRGRRGRGRGGFRKMREGKKGKEEREGDEPGVDTELSTMSKSRISRIGDDWELSAPEAAFAGEAGRDDGAEVEAGEGRGGAGGRRRRDSICSISDDEEDGYGRDRDRDRDDKAGHVQIQSKGGGGGSDDGLAAPPRRAGGASKFGLRTADTTASEFPTRKRTRDMEREIKRMLLLNAYPVMYVLLWIPGLVNRFMEATGNRSNSRALAALQASSQFVGLANALTYGFNKGLRTRVKKLWKRGGRKG